MMGAAKVLAALLASATVGAPIADAATVQVLFRSGDAAADGARLDSIDNPIATGPSTVIFRGGTSAILLRDGGGFGVVVRTGDPLPPPLVGTFNDLGDPVINGAGAVAFQAGVNSPTQRGGTFLYERGTFVPIGILTTEGVLFAPGLVTDLNDAGDVLFSSKRRRIDLWSRADGQIAHVVKNGDSAPGVRRFRRFGRQLVLSDGGVVVFQANFQPLRTRPRMPHVLTGIFAGTGPGRLSVIARQGDPSPVPGAAYGPLFDEALSINAAGEVAFTGRTDAAASLSDAVFLYRPTGPATSVVARVGDTVDGVPLRAIPPSYVGVDSTGRVAFMGCFADGSCRLVLASGGVLSALTGDLQRETAGASIPATNFAPRLTDGGQVAWQSGDDVVLYNGAVTTVLGAADATPIGAPVVAGPPSINNAGGVAFRARRDALYRLDDGGVRPVVAGGNAIGGAGHLRDIGIHAASPGTLAFVGREVEGRTVIAVDRGEGLAKVVASGEPTPLGGTFDLPGDGLALQGDSVLFSSAVKDGTAPAGLFRVDPGGGVAPLVRSGAAAPGGGRFKRIESVLTAGPRGVVFSATLDDDREGLYLVRGARVRQVAITGNRLPGVRGQSIASFDAVAASQGRVLFAAFGSEDGGALVLAGRGVIRPVAKTGSRAPGGGKFEGHFDAVTLSGKTAAFVAELTDSAASSGLFLVRGRRARLLVPSGVPTPVGGTLDLDGAQGMSRVGAAIVFRASLLGDLAKLALVAVNPN